MRIRVLLLALVVALFGALPAAADTIPSGGGANNVVLVQTNSDGAIRARASTQVVSVNGNTVASANIATATATGCTSCDSTAVAVQVLLVTGNPQYYVPANAATAANGGCTACGSFAYAWQYTLQTDGPVLLSAGAQQQIAVLRQEISDTAASIVPDSLVNDLLLQAQLDALTSQLQSVVDSSVQSAGGHALGGPVERIQGADGPAQFAGPSGLGLYPLTPS